MDMDMDIHGTWAGFAKEAPSYDKLYEMPTVPHDQGAQIVVQLVPLSPPGITVPVGVPEGCAATSDMRHDHVFVLC